MHEGIGGKSVLISIDDTLVFVKKLPLTDLDWCFVQAVLSWVWAIEDGCDDTYSKNLTTFFERYTDV